MNGGQRRDQRPPATLSFGLDVPEQDVASLAREAMEHAQGAMVSGNQHEAIRWFGRACRLLPRDPTLKLLLATACLRTDPARAKELLRDLAQTHDGLAVRAGLAALGAPADGAPLDPAQIEGLVDCDPGHIHGWAWHPHDPERDPVLTVVPDKAPRFTLVAAQPAEPEAGTLLARPRAFRLSWAGLGRRVHLLDAYGRDLPGSPVVFGAAQHPTPAGAPRGSGRPPPRRAPRGRPADVVIAAGGTLADLRDCLASVLRNTPAECRVFVVTHHGPSSALLRALDPGRRIRLVRLRQPGNGAAMINAGLRAAAPHDAVLLNAQARIGRHWIERLRGAAYAARDIGTATALTDDGAMPLAPDQAEAEQLAALTWRANGNHVIDVPFGEPHCLYLRRDCLDSTGLLRRDLFAQGWGAEHDFCLRARALGWRHVVASGVFAARCGSDRRDPAADALMHRNRRILRTLHPGYDALLQAQAAADPLHPARRRLDAARFRLQQRGRRSVLIITHNEGGGVERAVTAAVAAHGAAGRCAVVLRPADNGTVLVSDGDQARYPHLRFARQERAALLRFLRAVQPVEAEIHHLLGHDPEIADLPDRLAIPYSVHIHDHGWVCPRVVLIDPTGRYCGEPDATVCDQCIARAGTAFSWVTSTAAFRERCGSILAGARRVIAPSADTAARLRRYRPAQRVTVVPHEPCAPHAPAAAPASQPPHHVCVVGAIGIQKGYQVLLACAEDAAARNLPLRFTVVGTTIADEPLLRTGRVFITGPFMPDEASRLVREQGAAIGWLPSIWPETWCFALSDVWQAGLQAVVFDIGAQAERVRASGRGAVLPLALSPPRINQALLALSRM